MRFELIRNIDPTRPETWQDKIFITIDLDWCKDLMLEMVIDLLEEHNTKATFFVTHQTPLLERIRKNPNFELGIHPNFNPLLEGNQIYGKNYKEVIDFFMEIVPEAVSIRSHSITQNSKILDYLCEKSIKYDLNTFLSFNSGIIAKPFIYRNGLIKVPYFWEDDVALILKGGFDLKSLLDYEGIKVFNFHPIHIFLNTDHIHRYEQAKNLTSYKEFALNINKTNYGTCNFFLDLIKGG